MRRAPLLLLLGALGAAAPAPPPGLPDDGEVRRGWELAARTSELLPAADPSSLSCFSCHVDSGRRPYAAPWTGIAPTFPRGMPRAGRAVTLPERMRDCFERSLNGTSPALDGPEMKALSAYIGWLSREPVPEGRGVPPLISRHKPDARKGRALYGVRCAKCHGDDGAGRDAKRAPALWGPRSFNRGAGLARLTVAAAFIRRNMPGDERGALDDAQALDVAAYVVRKARPDFAGRAADWPRGGRPADAPR